MGHTLYIAEKPSLALAIAEALPGTVKKESNYFDCGNKNIVAWCQGHILEQVNPDEYDARYKSWKLYDLPIIPKQWKLKVSNPRLFQTIQKLAKNTNRIVHAGDPDREGQLLVDEVIEHLGMDHLPTQRLLISDTSKSAVEKALKQMGSNAAYLGLKNSALARSRADWLYGLNMTRLYTILGQKGGYEGVLSVGRVQTPLLSLVVRRDEEIANFKSKPFYTITGTIGVEKGSFDALWKPSQADENYLDEEGRLIDESHAIHIKSLLDNQNGVIAGLKIDQKKESPPLPFALKDIQILAAKKYDYSPDKTLEIAQSLYDTHKLITYPRSDCQYLPEGHLADLSGVFSAIAGVNFAASEIIGGADKSLKSKAWNDKKVKAHHGIIPTQNEKFVLPNQLSQDELRIYVLISTRYLIQFYPDHVYQQTVVNVLANDQSLIAKGKTITTVGWKSVEKSPSNKSDEANTDLPDITNGDNAAVNTPTITQKKTTPPKPFTYDTLLSAMSGIARYVTNEKVKALLSEAQGIGTPATQGNIIKGLFDREFLVKVGKVINSTEIGRSFINILPPEATTPDMTAFWEAAMSKIESGDMTFDRFIDNMIKQLNVLCDRAKEAGALSIPGIVLHKCTATSCDGNLGTRKGKDGKFWGCSNYPTCKQTLPNYRNKPDFDDKSKKRSMAKSSSKVKASSQYSCTDTDCKKPLVRRPSKSDGSHWWGCSGFPQCKKTYKDKDKKPVF